LVAEFGEFFEGAQDDFIQAHIDLDLAGGGLEAFAGEFASEEFVEDDAEGIDVGAAVDALGVGLLLGGAVAGGAEGGFGGVIGGGGADVREAVGGAEDFGDTEVGNLDAAGFIEEEVLGLDVAVDDAAVVGELEGVAEGGDDGEGFPGGEFLDAQQLAEVHAIDEFHEEVEEAAGLAEVVDGDNVGVVEGGEGAGFASEAFGELGVVDAFGGEELEGDEAVEGFLPGLVNDAHAAAAEEFEDLELGKVGGNLVRRQGRLGGGGVIGEDGFRLEVEGHEAGGAQAGGGAGREGHAALGTG